MTSVPPCCFGRTFKRVEQAPEYKVPHVRADPPAPLNAPRPAIVFRMEGSLEGAAQGRDAYRRNLWALKKAIIALEVPPGGLDRCMCGKCDMQKLKKETGESQ